jgi:hypothetical protein
VIGATSLSAEIQSGRRDKRDGQTRPPTDAFVPESPGVGWSRAREIRRRGDPPGRGDFWILKVTQLAARAQQAAMPIVGYLSSRSPDDTTLLLAGFRQGLADGGFLEHQNVTIEYRWGLGQYDQLPTMATELTRLPLAVVVSTGGEPAALAAKAATSTIPIVFGTGTDPVKAGLVASYNRPRADEVIE